MLFLLPAEKDNKVAVAARIVSADEADIRLDRWFRRHFPAVTQGAIQKLCRTGQVRVDGHRADAVGPATPIRQAGSSTRVRLVAVWASSAAASVVALPQRQERQKLADV